MLLEAAYLPSAPGLDPAIVFYSAVELSPGGWRRADAGLGVPESARRLTLSFGDPESPRLATTRALAVHEAIPFLISLTGQPVRPSVQAWIIASHLAQRLHEGTMLPRGTEQTDAILDKVARSMPASSHAVLIELLDTDDDLLGPISGNLNDGPAFGMLRPSEALIGFLDVAQHSYALGLSARTPPKRGSARTLTSLTLRLLVPGKASVPWRVAASVEEGTPRDAAARLLHEAAKVFRPLEPLTADSLDDPVELSADEASALIVVAAELQALGATIELPESLTTGFDRHVNARLRFGGRAGGGRAAAGARTGPRFRLDDLVSYDLQVALGGREVDAGELRKLARQAGALVQLDGDWVALTDASRDQLEKLARTIESRDSHMANSQALAAALAGSTQLPGGITAVVDRVDEEALARALDHLRSPERFPELSAPEGFVGELRPYQHKGLDWLAGMAGLPLGACLADDMGLGKTVQVIALLVHLKNNWTAEVAAATDEMLVGTIAGGAAGVASDSSDHTNLPPSASIADIDPQRTGQPAATDPFRTLVVCPTSLIGNWQRELARFGPDLKVHVHHGPQRVSRISHLDGFDVIVTSYGLVARDREMLGARPWSALIFDEAQSVKNPDTEQARGVRALRATFRVALTGTPMENRLLELWAILDLLNPGLLGRASVFNRRFAAPIERTGDEAAAATLRAITRPFMLRRVKNDPTIVPDLPEKQEHMVACTLTPEQAALYQATADHALAEVRRRDGIARRGAVLALLTKLKQICNHPAQALGQIEPIEGRSGKLERLEAMLDEVVSEGDRALVFTQYAQMGNLLASYLPDKLGCDVLYLHGGVPRPQREAMIQRFQDEQQDPMVFVLSLKAGGLGLNLMNAAHVFHYDRWWNPAVEDQATDRTHRIGQTRQIQVHKLVCAGTLEERIAAIIEDKRMLAGRIIEVSGSGEGWVTELQDSELEALVALSAADIVSA